MIHFNIGHWKCDVPLAEPVYHLLRNHPSRVMAA
jgi:hypothetical protein